MSSGLSHKSETTCLDAAAGLAILAREMCEDVEIHTFTTSTKLVPARRGFALRDAIGSPCGGTCIGTAVNMANRVGYDRLIVFTDEQSSDYVPAPKGKGYMVNIANHQNGVGYGKWVHVDGFSEHILKYIAEYERTKPREFPTRTDAIKAVNHIAKTRAKRNGMKAKLKK
jgi:hypothetical protein